MDLAAFANAIAFRGIQPEMPLDDHHAWAARPPSERGRFEVDNTLLPATDGGLVGRLGELLAMPRMSTLAIAALISRAVDALPAGHAFVNVGVWNGFSLLAGMAGHPHARCVGVDNFSGFGGPRDAFVARFNERRGPAHAFYERDYRDYFAREHAGPVGFYFYDGHHSYEHQFEGLRVAEPFFAPECWVLVDDVNWKDPRQATLDFVAGSARRYETVLDRATVHNHHPTWWNGVLLLRSTLG